MMAQMWKKNKTDWLFKLVSELNRNGKYQFIEDKWNTAVSLLYIINLIQLKFCKNKRLWKKTAVLFAQVSSSSSFLEHAVDFN